MRLATRIEGQRSESRKQSAIINDMNKLKDQKLRLKESYKAEERGRVELERKVSRNELVNLVELEGSDNDGNMTTS